ncbi:MAG: Type 1 glutamine amidotransferase-like domain-containing protein [Polyangiaceae bacterium]|nr:Type 1 glutamine amidotransferase-like domain-containing protein [Polyangiaceae bacterium]
MNRPEPPHAIVLCGAQRFDPTLGRAVRALGLDGPVALVTAGFQEREAEDQDIRAELGGTVENLRLHARADEAFAADAELRAAHRERQGALRHKQDFYRIRLEHALEAQHVVSQRRAPAAILAEEHEASLAEIRQLDAYHLGQCSRIHRAFETAVQPFERPAIARHRDELARILAASSLLVLAGGHVATLLNRLRLFGVAELCPGKPVAGFSGGAMVLCERVVLFHDSPPQGPGAAEVLDHGLGLCPGYVALPQPEMRLRLDDAERVSVMARRFAPARVLALPSGAAVTLEQGRATRVEGALLLTGDGTSVPFGPKGGA